jgi:hypothetical protein
MGNLFRFFYVMAASPVVFAVVLVHYVLLGIRGKIAEQRSLYPRCSSPNPFLIIDTIALRSRNKEDE